MISSFIRRRYSPQSSNALKERPWPLRICRRNSMQVTVPSASEAIRALKAKGYLLHKSYGPVRLTTRGARKAEELAERFSILRQFLVDVLKVSPPTADQEACEIEHVVGPDTLTRLNAYLVFLMQCGQDTARLTQHFHEFLENYLAGEACPDCGVTPATLKMDSASGS